MRHISGLYLAYTEKGRSMFTAEEIYPGEVIESCPAILIPEKERQIIHKTILHDYYFIWPEGGIAIALGYGSIYNHSSEPNARVIFDVPGQEIIIDCITKLYPGDEILIDYTDGEKDHQLWFDTN